MRRLVWSVVVALLIVAIIMAAVLAAGNMLVVLEPGEYADLVCTSGVYSVTPQGDGVRFGCFRPYPPCDPVLVADDGCEDGRDYPVYLPVVERADDN